MGHSSFALGACWHTVKLSDRIHKLYRWAGRFRRSNRYKYGSYRVAPAETAPLRRATADRREGAYPPLRRRLPACHRRTKRNGNLQ